MGMDVIFHLDVLRPALPEEFASHAQSDARTRKQFSLPIAPTGTSAYDVVNPGREAPPACGVFVCSAHADRPLTPIYFEVIGGQREGAGGGTLTRFLEPQKRRASGESMAGSGTLRSSGMEKKTFHNADFSTGGSSPDVVTT